MSRTPAHHGHPATELPGSERRSWALLAVALAAQVLVVLDISVVNTALPTIGRSLHLSGDDLQWLVTAYVMMSGGGLLLGGRVSDLLSRRVMFDCLGPCSRSRRWRAVRPRAARSSSPLAPPNALAPRS